MKPVTTRIWDDFWVVWNNTHRFVLKMAITPCDISLLRLWVIKSWEVKAHCFAFNGLDVGTEDETHLHADSNDFTALYSVFSALGMLQRIVKVTGTIYFRHLSNAISQGATYSSWRITHQYERNHATDSIYHASFCLPAQGMRLTTISCSNSPWQPAIPLFVVGSRIFMAMCRNLQ